MKFLLLLAGLVGGCILSAESPRPAAPDLPMVIDDDGPAGDVVAVRASFPRVTCGRRARGGCSGGQCGGYSSSGGCSAAGSSVGPVATYAPAGGCCPSGACSSGGTCPAPSGKAEAVASPRPGVSSGLDQVNARRAAAGLPLYRRCPDLEAAAEACVRYRARARIRGHVPDGLGDFRFLPAGVNARAAGADWYGATAEFATCAMYDTEYTEAGCASAVDDSGNWYHQIFVR